MTSFFLIPTVEKKTVHTRHHLNGTHSRWIVVWVSFTNGLTVLSEKHFMQSTDTHSWQRTPENDVIVHSSPNHSLKGTTVHLLSLHSGARRAQITACCGFYTIIDQTMHKYPQCKCFTRKSHSSGICYVLDSKMTSLIMG